ncbi:MAG: hypothetical protein AAF772_09825 [Acidobacteriota bacterium]
MSDDVRSPAALVERLRTRPLVPALELLRRHAARAGATPIALWARFERDGYLPADDAPQDGPDIPPYRWLEGQWFGEDGTVYLLRDPELEPLGRLPLIVGVRHLGAMPKTGAPLILRVPRAPRLIRERLGFTSGVFRIDGAQLGGMLVHIRREMLVRASMLPDLSGDDGGDSGAPPA